MKRGFSALNYLYVLTAVIALGLILSSIVTVANPVLLSDPGFENNGIGWSNIGFGGRSITSAQAYSGIKSLQVNVSKSYLRLVYQDVAITGGNAYNASGWIKTNGVGGNGSSIIILWLSQAGAGETPSPSVIMRKDVIGTASGTQNWKQISGTFIAPYNAVIARIQLYQSTDPDGSGAAWFDDLDFSSEMPDTNAPIISNVQATAGQTTATLAWTTDELSNSSVDYSAASLPGTTVSDSSLVISHSVQISGLLNSTQYFYRVTSCDVSNNCAASQQFNFSTTSQPPTPPSQTVIITSPADGSTISGTVTVSANVTNNNTKISDVQFMVDGQKLGSKDTTAPYSVSFNTKNVNNANHALSAVATDVSGKTVVSQPVTVRVYNSKLSGITYCTGGNVSLKMDIYYPPMNSSVPMPAAIYVHGGAWSGGSRTSGPGITDIPELTKRGYVVAAVDYRLAPTYKFPAFVEDVKCSVRYLRSKASYYNLDQNNIGVWGNSAGGHLAAMMGLTDINDNLEGQGGYPNVSSRVKAVVEYFGPADLTLASDWDNTVSGSGTVSDVIETAFGARPGSGDPVLVAGSPVTYATPDDPPFMIFQGNKDQTVPLHQSQLLYDTLVNASIPAQLVIVKNAGHGFNSVNGSISPTRAQITQMMANFLDSHLKQP